jgi:osmotically-inducible protein OsmY
MKRLLILLPVLFLPACVPVAVGAGASVGVAAAQEGGIKGSVTDKAIYLRVSDLWMKNSFEMYRKLDLNVKEGRVLVAGSLPTADMRVTAVRLAWQAEGVRQVINEIKVDEGGGVSGYVTDTWISGAIKSKILIDKYVQSINYNVDTVNGTVYIMGIAQDQRELNRVLDIARNTRYVKNVVSYARLRGEIPPGVGAPTNAPAAESAPAAPQEQNQDQGTALPPPADTKGEPLAPLNVQRR